MALVQAGKQFTADTLKETAGNLASMLKDITQDGLDFKVQLESWTAGDLIELGLTQPEIDAIKGFYIGDLPAVASALQASVWLKMLVGTGV
jgi:hypothetical protein